MCVGSALISQCANLARQLSHPIGSSPDKGYGVVHASVQQCVRHERVGCRGHLRCQPGTACRALKCPSLSVELLHAQHKAERVPCIGTRRITPTYTFRRAIGHPEAPASGWEPAESRCNPIIQTGHRPLCASTLRVFTRPETPVAGMKGHQAVGQPAVRYPLAAGVRSSVSAATFYASNP